MPAHSPCHSASQFAKIIPHACTHVHSYGRGSGWCWGRWHRRVTAAALAQNRRQEIELGHTEGPIDIQTLTSCAFWFLDRFVVQVRQITALKATMSRNNNGHPCSHGTHTHIHKCTHAHMHTCTHVHVHTCTHAHIHEHMCAHMRVRIAARTLLAPKHFDGTNTLMAPTF